MSKPTAKVIGQDGNVFVTLGICSSALKKVGQHQESKEMTEKVFSSGSYDEALSIMMEYCDLE
jgi:hypothetical protein